MANGPYLQCFFGSGNFFPYYNFGYSPRQIMTPVFGAVTETETSGVPLPHFMLVFLQFLSLYSAVLF